MGNEQRDRFKILVLAPYYLPGYKAGGPIKSLANLIGELSSDYHFSVMTLDRDIGDTQPYPEIEPNCWVKRGEADVLYINRGIRGLKLLRQELQNPAYDLIYINSLFNTQFSIIPLLMIWWSGRDRSNIIVAPRGELSSGALSIGRIKRLKKKFYLTMAKLLGVFKGLAWQATSESEKREIAETFRVGDNQLFIAPNISSINESQVISPDMTHIENDKLRLVFLSRISPKKNLDSALSWLAQVNQSILFDIYGPVEDHAYFEKCQRLVSELPANIQARFMGELRPDQVPGTLSRYDLFFFPTRGENYGHVIAEALLAGLPLLISDQTPWRGLEGFQAGWELPLDRPAAFIERIGQVAKMTRQERQQLKEGAMRHARSSIIESGSVEASRLMFSKLAQGLKK